MINLNLHDILILLIGVSMIYVSLSTRQEAYIKILFIQGLLLSILIALDFGKIETKSYIFLLIETFIFKTIIIPIFLSRLIHSTNSRRDVYPYIPNFFSILITSLIVGSGFFISYLVKEHIANVKTLYFGISISVIINSLFIIISRRKMMTHIILYMFLENGTFLLSLSVAKEMPLIVNLGILLDVFVGVFIFGIFASHIKELFDELDIDNIKNLKD
jgi:hydrogenase-4 component E